MEERRAKYSFGPVSSIDAETFGEPGKRTFRLVTASGLARSYIWLEKEQLFQLGIHLQEATRTLSEQDRLKESSPTEPAWDGGEELVEFKAQRMVLKYDVAANSFNLQAFAGDDSEGDEPEGEGASVSVWISPTQADGLYREALRICAAGRPPCFLCGLPINPEGHVCPRANGHAVMESG